MPKHTELVMTAMSAVDGVHSDTSVDAATTLLSLEEIRDHIEVLIEALKSTNGD